MACRGCQTGTPPRARVFRQWDKYRALYLSKNPLCVRCLAKGIYTPALVVDHIIPINGGGDVLFWPEWNHQALCQTCHNRKTTREDPATKANRKAGMYREQEERAHIVTTGCMAMMTEQEQNRLIRGLIRQRDLWKTQETGHKVNRTGRTERTTPKRLTDRDARSWNVFAIAGEAVRGGGGGFHDETVPAGHRPPPQIFVHGNFFEK